MYIFWSLARKQGEGSQFLFGIYQVMKLVLCSPAMDHGDSVMSRKC